VLLKKKGRGKLRQQKGEKEGALFFLGLESEVCLSMGWIGFVSGWVE